MKELKFRAYDKKEKKWLCGYELPNLGGFSLFGELVMLGEWSNILNTYLFDRDNHSADDLVVMQYTGLKDKNGKEIYDSDIVRFSCDDVYNDEIGEVVWSGLSFGFMLQIAGPEDIEFWEDENMWTYEVIGNIYEHPNLLQNES